MFIEVPTQLLPVKWALLILARLFLLQLNLTLGLLLRQLPASQESNLAHAIFIRVDRRFQVQFVLRRERLKQGA